MNSVEASAFPITDYESVPVEELFDRTRAAKKALGDQVLILGHNYQRDEVIVHADLRGTPCCCPSWRRNGRSTPTWSFAASTLWRKPPIF